MREFRAEDARSEARRLIHDLLGEGHPTAALLLSDARSVLGDERTANCAELARGAALTRRSSELAAIAGLLVGTRTLGLDWWTSGRGGKIPAPDEVLAANTAIEPWTDLTVLEMLAAWIADDGADDAWGPPITSVDLNSWQAEDRVDLPADAVPGHRLVVSFDAGGRLDAVVVERPDGALGSNLDFSSLRYSRAAEAQWSWGVAAGLGPHPLPGEDPDPYAETVDAQAAEYLRQWALRHGATAEQAGGRWQVKGEVVAVIERVDWMWRSGEWFAWWRAASALLGGDPVQLASRMDDIAAAS
ncbi:hypothetical protein Sme01_08750 [Sphaerisporangium melleum]|uniref:Uncharacterized protein n=1 Tax=Sphaerisporangium melleum TaxID=321316 RepID=A0A917VET2_9ACTN|nr:hypothetical protein [Sphaerisporangium melleum]GGK71904.1 hypothetical protein GCM10007964_13440 [Sphaerisporangium melleum]GII68399.1 hypothetical protein Sme01_08750 [Sphaerisporangium melleum]